MGEQGEGEKCGQDKVLEVNCRWYSNATKTCSKWKVFVFFSSGTQSHHSVLWNIIWS